MRAALRYSCVYTYCTSICARPNTIAEVAYRQLDKLPSRALTVRVITSRIPAGADRRSTFYCPAGAPVDGMLPMLTEATIRQMTDLNLMDQKGHPIPLEAKLRLLRFLRVTALTLRYRRHLSLDLHSKVSADSVSAMFLCYLLFHSVRPDTYLKGPCPAECLYAHPKQIASMLSGSNKEVAQALSCKAFCSSSTKLAQSMTYPQHIWDQRNFVCCFQAMLDHIQHQMVAESGAWRLSTPWGQWQAMPTYARHLQSNPLGAFGDVLGLMQNLGKPIDIY